MRRVLLTVSVVWGMTAPSAGAWIPEECGAEHAKAMAEHRRLFLKEAARPGGIPAPYPDSPNQVLANLRAELLEQLTPTAERSVVGTGASQVEKGRTFLSIWDKQDLRFDVLDVENWTPSRCAPTSDLSAIKLVRAWQISNRREIMRAALGRDGHLSQWAFSLQATLAPHGGVGGEIKSLEEGRIALSELVGPGVEGIEYVAVSGRGIRCSVLAPCVVARNSSGTVALVKDGQRFRFRTDSPRWDQSQVRQGVMPPSNSPAAVLITIGGKRVVVAEEVND